MKLISCFFIIALPSKSHYVVTLQSTQEPDHKKMEIERPPEVVSKHILLSQKKRDGRFIPNKLTTNNSSYRSGFCTKAITSMLKSARPANRLADHTWRRRILRLLLRRFEHPSAPRRHPSPPHWNEHADGGRHRERAVPTAASRCVVAVRHGTLRNSLTKCSFRFPQLRERV